MHLLIQYSGKSSDSVSRPFQLRGSFDNFFNLNLLSLL